MELNKVTFPRYENNSFFTVSTSLIGNKIKIVCEDDNSAVYENIYSVEELTKISKYFKSTYTIEQIQLYLNGILEKKKSDLNPGDETIILNLYLINHDHISIPLSKKKDNIGMDNYSNKKEEGLNYNNYNNYHNYDNYEIQISELKRKLKEEKDKNQKLINDNYSLKEKINSLNIELNQIKVLNAKLSNDLSQKNIEIQKLLSPPKKVKNIMICLL